MSTEVRCDVEGCNTIIDFEPYGIDDERRGIHYDLSSTPCLVSTAQRVHSEATGALPLPTLSAVSA